MASSAMGTMTASAARFATGINRPSSCSTGGCLTSSRTGPAPPAAPCQSSPTTGGTMYDECVDYLVTPRPQYLADGGKLPDVYTHPASLRDRLQAALGTFPLHRFWGPLTSIESSRWIAE